jgi:predicted patatin/cPLA2 family phospholipase
MIPNTGLVLEGGGMRGLYTAGVVDCFLKHNIHFPYVIGVSAGACIAYSYVAQQSGRDRHIMTTFINDQRYFSLKNLLHEGNIFSRNFLYKEIHEKHVPLDMETFQQSPCKVLQVATNCSTGQPEYFDGHAPDFLTTLAASASLPFVSKMVEHNGQKYLDGGLSDSIPIRKSIADGNTKNIIVLTRPKGYRKKPSTTTAWLARKVYSKYPQLAEAMANRYRMYNETLDYIEQLENENKVIVIRPSQTLPVDRIEKNVDKLHALYNLGHQDANCVNMALLN